MSSTFALSLVTIFLLACGGGTTPNIDAGTDSGSGNDSGNDSGTTNDGSTGDASKDVNVGDGSGGPCNNGVCTGGLSCCAGECVNESNDPHNCGGCGSGCGAGGSGTMMCFNSSCVAAMCQPACGSGQICCEIEQGVSASQCVTGTTCPVGCPLCN